MASYTLILLTLIPFLLLSSQIKAQTAPAPSSSDPINITAILEDGGQFTFLINLLNQTQQLTQIESQLNSTSEGFTIFAPTDNAFQNLKAAAINDLTNEQKVQLILYHVTPKYYSLSDLLTVSNPVRTQAPWGLNFSGQGNNQVNVSTGVVTTRVSNPLRQEFPLAVYTVDDVLLPEELFGESPTAAPSPKSAKTPSGSGTPSTAEGPAPGSSRKDNSDGGRINGGFGSLVVGFSVICMGVLLS